MHKNSISPEKSGVKHEADGNGNNFSLQAFPSIPDDLIDDHNVGESICKKVKKDDNLSKQ